MTTLGALSVGLLVLVLIVAAGIALLARSQRRAPRGPEQPRTVADLVRMRESAAQERTAGATVEPPQDLVADAEPEAEAENADSFPSASLYAVAAPEGAEDSEDTTELVPPVAAGAAPTGVPTGVPAGPQAAVEAPETGGEAVQPAPLLPGQLNDTPWARAARMADPMGEWTASARAALEREGTTGPHPLPDVAKRQKPVKGPVAPPQPRLSLIDPDRAALEHDTTTIAHLPKGLVPPPAADAVAERAAAERAAAERAAAAEQAAAEEAAAAERAVAEQAAAAERAVAEQAAAAERAAAERAAAVDLDDETVRIAERPGGAPALQAVADPDDSTTVDFAPPAGERPARPAEEPTGPVEPTAFGACETTVGPAAQSAAQLGAIKLLAPPIHTPARVAGRIRRSPADTAAEQAAADLALLRTFGVAGPGRTAPADDTEVELEGCSSDDAEPSAGTSQPVAFRVVDRDGRGLAGASVTLLDDHGREISGTTADEHGSGRLTARSPGGYMLVTAAEGYQPGAVTILVADAPVDTEIPLTRSASIAGSVCGEDGPVVGAHLALVQDGEIVDTAESGVDGAYVFADLAAGEYGLSVTAPECEPMAVVLRLVDEVDLRHDVDLDPVGLPSGGGATDDVMIGHL